VNTLADIVRAERSRVMGALVRMCHSLAAAEDAFQEAAVSALVAWQSAVPDNPAAWLTTVAKNKLRDAQRHTKIVERYAVPSDDVNEMSVQTISDDQLRLIFTCCHPALAQEAQVALTLKIICGFETEEIARAFLVAEETMAQRIVRAKKFIDDRKLPYVVPERRALAERLSAALAVVYLLFNAGYTSRSGPLMRIDLQAEALRLGRLLTELVPRAAEAFGLFALMAFAASRANTREKDGVPLLLSEQDRSAWNLALIREGVIALGRARSLDGRERYVLQAEMAECHATAETWERTDWAAILALYDELLALSDSPVVALNRAVAVCMLNGPALGLEALTGLEPHLRDYHLFFATRADFLSRLGRDAAPDYARALALTTNEAEQKFLRKKLVACGQQHLV
jgi:RNA polymerase sigma-70 factor (ECF subfamily)